MTTLGIYRYDSQSELQYKSDHSFQSSLPDGHSFVGVIGASDKTPLTLGSGNKEMHLLLLSLTNIHADVHMKASSHAFALAAYLPIPSFSMFPPPSNQFYQLVFTISLSQLSWRT